MKDCKLRNIAKLRCSAILPGCLLLIYNTIKPCMRVHGTGYIDSIVQISNMQPGRIAEHCNCCNIRNIAI